MKQRFLNNPVLKCISVVLSVLIFMGVFTTAYPTLAAYVTEGSEEASPNEASGSLKQNVEILDEITELRKKDVKYFRQSDGSILAAQYGYPVHYEKNGEWLEIDNSLAATTEKETGASKFKTKNTDKPVELPQSLKADGSQKISVETNGYEIEFAPKEGQNGLKAVNGKVVEKEELKSLQAAETTLSRASIFETATKEEKSPLKAKGLNGAVAYENVFSDVDFEYEISSSELKESIVLKKKQDKNVFEFAMDFGGLYPVIKSDGSIDLCENENGENAVAKIAAPYMFDKSGAYSEAVTMSITEVGGGYTLTVEADKEWLNDNAREYPVVIDPTIELEIGSKNTFDCYVDNSQPNTSIAFANHLLVGKNSLGLTRTFVKYTLPDLPDENYIMTNATACFLQKSLDNISSSGAYMTIHRVTEDWENDLSVTWNNQPSYDSEVLDYADYVNTSGYQYNFDITRLVKEWYNGETPNYGIMLKAANESIANRVELHSADSYDGVCPVIQVTFRNNKGIEGYWSYSSYGIGSSGAAYVNDYTGNLVVALPLMSSVSAFMPLSLTAVFNNYCANEKLTVGKNGSSRTSFARGFKLNIQESVLPSSDYGYTGEAATNYPYIYADADGTEHAFVKVEEDDKTVYKDEDGLGLTLEVGGECTYRIVDKADNIRYFNSKGNLFKMTDANGNEIHVYFKGASTADDLPEKTRISYITDGAGHKFTFSYYVIDGVETDYVKTITDDAGRKVTLTTQKGLLRKITYPDSTKTVVKYEAEDDSTPDVYEETAEGLINYVLSNDGYGVNFDYSSKALGRTVTAVKEFGTNDKGAFVRGQVVTFDRTKYNTTVIRSGGVDGVNVINDSTKGEDDVLTTLQFDNWGRTVSQQVKLANGTNIGSGSYSYVAPETLGQANKVDTTATLGKNTVNLLKGGNGDDDTLWSGDKSDSITGSRYDTANHKYMGVRGLGIYNTSLSAKGVNYFKQDVTGVSVGATYTLSAYVKTHNLAKVSTITPDPKLEGAYIQLRALNSSGSEIETVYSDVIDEITDTKINNGFRRLNVSLTLPEGTAKIRVYLCLRDMTGYAYFDSIQLEKSSSVNGYNMLENSGFEKSADGKMPDSWSTSGLTYTAGKEGITTAKHAQGSQAVMVKGEPGADKKIYQTVTVEGNENDTYILAGWGGGSPVNSTFHREQTAGQDTENDSDDDEFKDTALFELLPKVTYTKTDASGNTSTVTQYKNSASFNTTIKTKQFTSTAFSLKYVDGDSGCTYTPTKITVILKYENQANTAWFDHIMLSKEPATTYVYDKDGNPVSTAANAEQKVNSEYDDNDNLISYTDTAGNETKAEYDDKHNLLKTESPRGLFTKNTYNANGTPYITEVRNAALHEDATLAIRTHTTYFSDDSSTSYNESAFVNKVYDQHGNATSYTYDFATGAKKTTKNAKGVTTTNTYDSGYNRLLGVGVGSSTVSYNYKANSNRLESIRFGTEATGETYGFNYDAWGNIISVNVGTKALSTNTYNQNNGLLSLTTYGNGDKISYEYNSLGLVKSLTRTDTDTDDGNDEATKFSWSYSGNGTPRAHRDNVNNLRYTYDYDSLGRLVRSTVNTTGGDYVGMVEQGFDVRNNVSRLTTEFGGLTHTQQYFYETNTLNANSASYSKDNLPSAYKFSSNRYATYDYDSLNRLNKRTFTLNGRNLYNNYVYWLSDRNAEGSNLYRTTQLKTELVDNTAYTYTYDKVGNITAVKKGTRTNANTDNTAVGEYSAYRSYVYDDLGQLTMEIDHEKGKAYGWTYDSRGNIGSRSVYSYANGQVGAKTEFYDYVYGTDADAGWKKLLTSYNGEAIDYDEIGNPIVYRGADLLWNGRQLRKYKADDFAETYFYNADGLRVRTKHYIKSGSSYELTGETRYEYVGSSLAYQVTTNVDGAVEQELYFFYDASGNLSVIRQVTPTKDYHFYVTTNAQGDVLGIYSSTGTLLASYEYDAWGNCTISYDNPTYNIGATNPIRYRGYYYDSETKLYYLQSRYYDPEIGRFLNADDAAYLGADGTILSNNLFAYCTNSPLIKIDETGNLGIAIGIFIGVSSIIGCAAGALTAASTGSNILEGALEGAALGAVAATATVAVPLLLPSAGVLATAGVTFGAASVGGMVVDYTTQRISHELSENSDKKFDLDENRLIKTGVTTGIAGVVPTYGNPANSVVNSIGSLAIGFDASIINSVIEIVFTRIFK